MHQGMRLHESIISMHEKDLNFTLLWYSLSVQQTCDGGIPMLSDSRGISMFSES